MKITLQDAEKLVQKINGIIEDQQFAMNGQAFNVCLVTNGADLIDIMFLNQSLYNSNDVPINDINDVKIIVEGNLKALVESISAIKI